LTTQPGVQKRREINRTKRKVWRKGGKPV